MKYKVGNHVRYKVGDETNTGEIGYIDSTERYCGIREHTEAYGSPNKKVWVGDIVELVEAPTTDDKVQKK